MGEGMSSTEAKTREMLKGQVTARYYLEILVCEEAVEAAEKLCNEHTRAGKETDVELFYGPDPHVRLDSRSLEGLLDTGVEFYNITDKG